MAAQRPRISARHRFCASCLVLVGMGLSPSVSTASERSVDQSLATAGPPEPNELGGAERGRPSVKLDRLDFPVQVADRKYLKRHLERALKRDARNADWGAGTGARIEFRVEVNELKLTIDDGVLRVKCSMIGRLPNGKTTRSHLTFGGAPRKRRAVVAQVLEIVGRGVITRLAELEKERRDNYRGASNSR